jgi:hypothetical protein
VLLLSGLSLPDSLVIGTALYEKYIL